MKIVQKISICLQKEVKSDICYDKANNIKNRKGDVVVHREINFRLHWPIFHNNFHSYDLILQAYLRNLKKADSKAHAHILFAVPELSRDPEKLFVVGLRLNVTFRAHFYVYEVSVVRTNEYFSVVSPRVSSLVGLPLGCQ